MFGRFRNLAQMCRVCLGEKIQDFAHLFTDELIAHKILICTRVKIVQDDILPKIICSDCLQDLNCAYAFHQKLLTSNQILQEYIQKKHSETADTALKEEFDERDTVIAKNYSSAEESLDKAHTCSVCNKIFNTKSDLLNHLKLTYKCQKTGHGTARRHNCSECEYSTRHSQSLVYHMRTHTGERPHSCWCGATFTQPSALSAHNRTHSSVMHHTCPTCGKQFKLSTSFKRHQLVHSERKFSCATCGKTLRTKRCLDAHVRRHLGIRNYSCEKCGVCFVTSSELINHSRKHDVSQRDRFQCNFCAYSTHSKKALIAHIKRHTDERPFKCDVCVYTAHTRGQLKQHIRTHTRQKNYPCPSCGQRFVHSSSLNKHMRRLHNNTFLWNRTVDRTVIDSTSDV